MPRPVVTDPEGPGNAESPRPLPSGPWDGPQRSGSRDLCFRRQANS